MITYVVQAIIMEAKFCSGYLFKNDARSIDSVPCKTRHCSDTGRRQIPLNLAPYLPRMADWLFQDLSMPDQAKSFINSTSIYWEKGPWNHLDQSR